MRCRNAASRPEVMLVGSRGNFCTGVAIARDLVLTAAHCVPPGADYKLVEFDAERKPVLKDVRGVARHPQFDLKTMLAHRATADVALVKLASAAQRHAGAAALRGRASRSASASLVAATACRCAGDGNSGGTLRAATLVATGQPGNLQLRLVDPATGGNERPGLGACTGDSGAPGLCRRRRPSRGHRRGELVDRRERQRRLRRPHRRHAARALSRLDRRDRGEARLAARAVTAASHPRQVANTPRCVLQKKSVAQVSARQLAALGRSGGRSSRRRRAGAGRTRAGRAAGRRRGPARTGGGAGRRAHTDAGAHAAVTADHAGAADTPSPTTTARRRRSMMVVLLDGAVA